MTTILTPQQSRALRKLSEAYGELSNVWTDDFNEMLADQYLLPLRDLQEAEAELLHIADECSALPCPICGCLHSVPVQDGLIQCERCMTEFYPKDGVPAATCQHCGKTLPESEVNVIDYDVDTCVDCERRLYGSEADTSTEPHEDE